VNLKILMLGNYSLRYSNFNMVVWDAQIRGFEKLGYRPYTLDIKDYSFSFILKWIEINKPDILWVAGKIVINFFKKFGDYFKNSKIKVVYWMWDVRNPIKYDFKNIIDVMFISSKGEIPLYKENYNLERIYYMITPVTPQLLRVNRNIRKVYDIGFAGRLDKSPAHIERTKHLKILMKYFKVKSVSNIYNNIPEFYSKCKIIFGGAPDYKDLELYSSFRMYYVLCCGSCYLTNRFKGIERIAENEIHLLCYETIDEMLEIVNKYLANNHLRYNIENNSRKLAIENYHYAIRIKNMMDIVDGKSNGFNGFLY
ncbi:MAG: glycosyltransferase, partial [Promethearchaeota archaeon]